MLGFKTDRGLLRRLSIVFGTLFVFFALGSVFSARIHPDQGPGIVILVLRPIYVPTLLLLPIIILDRIFSMGNVVSLIVILSFAETTVGTVLFAWIGWGFSLSSIIGDVAIGLILLPVILWVNNGKQK